MTDETANNPASAGEGAAARQAATQVVRRLQESGHIAYFAGGCVRDQLLGKEPDDYDVATDAQPDRVTELFPRAQRVGEAFGVMLVRMRRCAVEVATFRAEWGFADGRHPDHVRYTDARTDAFRRDFTINGLFFDPVTEEIHDFVGGREDLRERKLRAIGKPEERLAEDYLRMLRAVRFAARLGFEIEPQTAQAIRLHAADLGRISRERIGMEVAAMLQDPHRARAADLLEDFALDAQALGEPNLRSSRAVLGALEEGADYPTALAAWLIDRHLASHGGRPTDWKQAAERIGQIKTVQKGRHWRDALMLSNEQRQGLIGLIEGLSAGLDWKNLTMARRKRLLGRHDWPGLGRLLGAVLGVYGGQDVWRAMLEETGPYWTQGVKPDPLVTGDDLIAQGLRPGPRFKEILDAVYDAQLENRVADKAAALAEALRMTGQAD